MERIADYEELRKRLHGIGSPALIGIEGFTGSGKSYLADTLAVDLNAVAVHVDAYVAGEDESLPYWNRINHLQLAAAVEASRSQARLTIIEGICLREILQRARLSVALFVYLKRVAENGLWHDGFHLEDFETEGEITENQKEPHRSDFSYHARKRPHERADVIFERVEHDAEA